MLLNGLKTPEEMKNDSNENSSNFLALRNSQSVKSRL